MTRIGILTFARAHNYGAVLQAYALSSYLRREYNAQVDFIDYLPSESGKAYSLLPQIKRLSDIRKLLFVLANYSTLKKKHVGFSSFLQKNLPMSERFENSVELSNAANNYDVIITGSDQVFKYKNENSEPFFLGFCDGEKTRKIAYAPSFGGYSVQNAHRDRVKALLEGIEYLSCREESGAKAINEITGLRVPVVCDPVFLLSDDDWKEIQSKPKNIPDVYVLCYALVGTERQMKLAQEIRSITNLPIVLIGSIGNSYGADHFIMPSPQEFIYLFRNAIFVVTDSFHGTAFSILFKKRLWAVIVLHNAASRLLDLLSNLGISDRIYNEDANGDILCTEIDYSLVEKRVTAMTSISRDFLFEAIKGERKHG